MEVGASRHVSSPERDAAAGDSTQPVGEQAPNGSGERAGLVDATQYDFERLERAVGHLVEQQAQLLAHNEALREQLEDRERRIHELDSELDDSNGRRRKAMERLDSLITELDRLDEGLERSLQSRGGIPAETDVPGHSAD